MEKTPYNIDNTSLECNEEDNMNGSKFDCNNAVNKLAELCNNYQNLQKFREIHKTEREKIKTFESIALEKIRSDKDTLEKLLYHTFKEREQHFEKYFKLIDEGIKSNNPDQINLGCNFILSQINNNPISQLQNTRRFLKSKGGEIDL